MNRAATFLLVLALPALPGCFLFPSFGGWDDWDEPPTTSVPPAYNDGTLLIEQSSQFGDMGDIRGFAADSVASNASYYGDGASFRLDSIGDGWWVMSYFTVSNLDLLGAPAGTYRTISDVYDGSAPYVSVTGCSGPTYGNYTFDANTQDAELTITDNADGSRSLEFRARFERYGYGGELQEVTGTAVFRAGDVAAPPTYGYAQTIVASDLSQQGDMGAITGFSGAATSSSGEYYGSGSSIRLDSIGEGWWVMSYLYVNNLDLANAPAGTYRTTSAAWSDEDPQIGVTGCSGPTYGNYTFDAGSQEAEITISDDADGSRWLELTALFTYGDASQVATARFRYTINGTSGSGGRVTTD